MIHRVVYQSFQQPTYDAVAPRLCAHACACTRVCARLVCNARCSLYFARVVHTCARAYARMCACALRVVLAPVCVSHVRARARASALTCA